MILEILAIVIGKVQGVGYRYFTFKIAEKYNLKGYVKNLSNGKVEVLFQGEKEALEKAVNELWIGPFKGLVRNIDLKEQESIKIYKDFFII